MSARWVALTLFLGAGAAGIGAGACGEELDTTRVPVDPGSFGTVAYTLACKRLAWDEDRADGGKLDVSGAIYRELCRRGTGAPPNAYPAVRALDGERADLIAALDASFPERELDRIQGLIGGEPFLALYDDGTVEHTADRLAASFALMAGDPDFTAAMARLDGKVGLRPAGPAMGALHSVAAYPELDEVLRLLPAALGPGGTAHEAFSRLTLAASRELLDAQPAARRDDPERTLNLAAELLLTESPLLGTERPRWLTRRDPRGLPLVEKDGAAWPAPFVDKDADGLADADAMGRFLDAAGKPVTVPTPLVVPWLPETAVRRDAAGRAQTAAAKLLYGSVDLDRTVVAALAREARELFSPTHGTGLSLVRGAAALLGSRRTVHKTYAGGKSLDYLGFETGEAALLDLAHAYMTLLGAPQIDDTLAIVRTLLVDHEATAARLLEALLATADLGKTFPDARLEAGSPFYDDLIPVVNEILAVPGLAEDILRALEDPALRPLGRRVRDLMTYRDALDFDPGTQAVVGTMKTAVDRTQPDTGFNRSLLQRILHLINDSAGHRLCNKDGGVVSIFGIGVTFPYAECELLEIDDLALFYVQSIAYAKDAQGRVLLDDEGRPLPKAHMALNLPLWMELLVSDSIMEWAAGIDGFRFHPTPQALNRILFLSPQPEFVESVLDPPECKDGDTYVAQHSGSLAALELNGTYDALRPLVQPFADRGREDLFVKALVVLHSHWPSRASLTHQRQSPGGHGYARMSDIRSWEPFVAKVLEDDALWSALTSGAATLDAVRAPSGKLAPEVLAGKARYLFAPKGGLAKRGGATSTTTEDGKPVVTLSPWYLLADAYKAKRARLAQSGADGELWPSATGQLLDLLARGDAVGQTWRFRDPRFRGVVAALIDFLRRRVTAHRTAGDLDAWLAVDLPRDTERVLAGPVFAGAADLVTALSAAPEARAALEGLLVHLNTDGNPAFDTTVTVAADLVQWYVDDRDLVPLTRLAGKALDPELGLVDATLSFVRKARAVDGAGVIAGLLGRLDGELVPGRTAQAQISDAVSEVHRERPFSEQGQPLSAADYQRVFGAVGGFLSDEKRGLMKFAAIVKDRAAR